MRPGPSVRLVVNQIIEESSGEAYWKARVESQGKAGGRPKGLRDRCGFLSCGPCCLLWPRSAAQIFRQILTELRNVCTARKLPLYEAGSFNKSHLYGSLGQGVQET